MSLNNNNNPPISLYEEETQDGMDLVMLPTQPVPPALSRTVINVTHILTVNSGSPQEEIEDRASSLSQEATGTRSVAGFITSKRKKSNIMSNSNSSKSIEIQNHSNASKSKTNTETPESHENQSKVKKAKQDREDLNPKPLGSGGRRRRISKKIPSHLNTPMNFGAIEPWVVHSKPKTETQASLPEEESISQDGKKEEAEVIDLTDDDVEQEAEIQQEEESDSTLETPFPQNLYNTPKKRRHSTQDQGQEPKKLPSSDLFDSDTASLPQKDEDESLDIPRRRLMFEDISDDDDDNIDATEACEIVSSADKNKEDSNCNQLTTNDSTNHQQTAYKIDFVPPCQNLVVDGGFIAKMQVEDGTRAEDKIPSEDCTEDDKDAASDSSSAAVAISGQNDDFGAKLPNVKAPNKRKYKSVREVERRESTSSVSSSSSSPSVGQKRRISGDSDDTLPDSLIKVLKKKFSEDAKWNSSKKIDQHTLLFKNMDARELTFLLQRYFLKANNDQNSRPTSMEVQDSLKFFINGLNTVLDQEKELPSVRDRSFRIILDSFDMAYDEREKRDVADSKNAYWRIFVELISQSGKTGQSGRRTQNKDSTTITLIEHIIKLMEVTYEEYSGLNVKLSLPFVAKLFQGPVSRDTQTKIKNVHNNFKELVPLILSFSESEHSKEFAVLIVVFNLFVRHITFIESKGGYGFLHTQDEMCTDVWESIRDRADLGVPIIKMIQRKEFGEMICQKLIFYSLPDLWKQLQSANIGKDQADQILKEIVQSNLVLEILKFDYDHGPKPTIVDRFKGETVFHRACSLRSNKAVCTKKEDQTSVEYLTKLLDDLLDPESDTGGDINFVDNNKNTCLHDACQNGRLDALRILFDRCWNPKQEPNRFNLDILATDRNGNSPLHIALSSLLEKLVSGSYSGEQELRDQVEIIKLIVKMANAAPKKKQILFQMENARQETIFDFHRNMILIEPISNEVNSILQFHQVPRINKLPGGFQLSNATEEKIKNSKALQLIFAYWEYFISTKN